VSRPDYLHELGHELTRAGVRGRRRERIVTEFADHLACDPVADLGTPAALARQFADELGTSRALRGAGAAFAALAVAGILFGVAFLLAGYLSYDRGHARSVALGTLASVAGVIASQVAFAAGTLAALRAFHLRRHAVLPRAEATVVVRRALVAVAAGLVTMGALALLAIEFPHAGSASTRAFSLVAAAVGAAALLAVLPALISAARLRPAVEGEAGDFVDDLGPFVLPSWRGHPWRPAVLVAVGVCAAVTLAGVIGSDPYDGLLRGILDAAACLVGFGVLGRFLGMLPAPTGRADLS
jgi:MFS family permease